MASRPESELAGGLLKWASLKLLLGNSLGTDLENVHFVFLQLFSWTVKFENYCSLGNDLGSWVLVNRFIDKYHFYFMG